MKKTDEEREEEEDVPYQIKDFEIIQKTYHEKVGLSLDDKLLSDDDDDDDKTMDPTHKFIV